jgi:hypothetical protein
MTPTEMPAAAPGDNVFEVCCESDDASDEIGLGEAGGLLVTLGGKLGGKTVGVGEIAGDGVTAGLGLGEAVSTQDVEEKLFDDEGATATHFQLSPLVRQNES